MKVTKSGTKKLRVTSKNNQIKRIIPIASTIIVSRVAEVAENYRKLDPVGAEPVQRNIAHLLIQNMYLFYLTLENCKQIILPFYG